jgi:hypothetical protein
MKKTTLPLMESACAFTLLASLLLTATALPASRNESDSTITNHYNYTVPEEHGNFMDNATSYKGCDRSEKVDKVVSTQLKGNILGENETARSSESGANNESDAPTDHPIKPIGESKEDGLVRVNSPRFSKVILEPSPPT